MKRMIAVVDLTSGEVLSLPSSTPTLDLPGDFDRGSSATLDERSRARYQSVLGREVVAQVLPRPLSWRVRSEECLVADHDEAVSSHFSLMVVEPERS